MHLMNFFSLAVIYYLGVLRLSEASVTQNSNGDIVVDLSDGFVRALDPLDTSCKAQKRDDNVFDCLFEGTEEILQDDSTFAWLNEEAQNIDSQIVPRNFIDPDENQAFGQVLVYAGAHLPRRGLPQNRILPMAEIAYLLKLARWYQAGVQLKHFVISATKRSTKDFSPICTSGDAQPGCSNALCQGQNGKCTSDFMKGCACNDDSKCPPDDRWPDCSNCGGDDGFVQCKGLSDHNNLWQGCQCFTGPQISSVVAFPDDGSFNKALDYFKNIQHDSTPKGRQCFGIKTSTYVQLSGAMSAVETFSGDDDLVTGKTGETKEFTYYPGTINELKLSIQFKGSDPNPRTIWKVGNAEDLFHDIINNCDGNDPANPDDWKHGGTNTHEVGHILTFQPIAGDPKVACDPPDPSGLQDPYKVAMRRDSIISSINDFCHNNDAKDIGDGLSTTYGPWGPGSSPDGFGRQAIGLRVNRPGVQTEDCGKWDGKLSEDACKRAFMGLTDFCNTNTVLAKRGGSTDFACATYKIEGSGGADTYRMHLHQQMVDDFQQLEWTVWDSRGKQVGGPSTSDHPTGAPYEIGFWVDSPNDRDATNIRIFYPTNPVQAGLGQLWNKWSTGWTGSPGSQSYTPAYFCDDVLDTTGPAYWKSWTGPQRPGRWGFEREFDCYFRGWRDGDGMAGEPPSG